jgi:hypothetical protein
MISVLLLLSLFRSSDPPIVKLFHELKGTWHGQFVSSDSDDHASLVVAKPTLYATPAVDHLVITLAEMPELIPTLFLKPKPNTTDSLVLMDETAEEIADLTLRGGGSLYYFVLRGLVAPKNDQITVTFEPHHLSIAVTDQFSPNVTLLTFDRKSKGGAFVKIGQAGIILTVAIALIYGLYKLGDMSDLVTPVEAAEAELIKQRSRAADRVAQTKKKQQ